MNTGISYLTDFSNINRHQHYALFVTGYAGAGESTIASILSELTGSMLLDKDSAVSPFVEAMLEHEGIPASDRDSDYYRDNVRGLEYQVMENIMEDNLSLGIPVISSAPWTSELVDDGFWERWKSKAKKHNFRIIVIWAVTDKETMHQRIVSRAEERDGVKLSQWDDYSSQLNLSHGNSRADIIIDNSGDVDELALELEAMSHEALL